MKNDEVTSAPQEKEVKEKVKTKLQVYKDALDDAISTADKNYEYAKQTHEENEKLMTQALDEKQKLKDVISSVAKLLDTIENTIALARKAIQSDLKPVPRPLRQGEINHE